MSLKVAFIFTISCLLVSLGSSAPSPGYLGGYHALPAATSYSSRVDIHGPEYIKTYAAPVIAKTVIAAPIVKTVIPSYHAEPLLGYSSYGYGLGHGYGYGSGLEHGLGYGHGHGLGYDHGLDGYSHGLGGHYY